MVDHIHILVVADKLDELRRFVHDYSAWFSRSYNTQHHLSGSLFSRPFGFASKTTSKEIRSAIAYLYNNPVERKQCGRPELARWNYLAYGHSCNPFSEPIRLDKASRPLRAALKTVKQLRSLNSPLTYTMLKRMFEGLSKCEHQQLIDYIISAYNCIDHATVSRYYDGYQNMVTAVNTTKGSEYEMNEEFAGKSDNVYNKMSQYLIEHKIIGAVDDLLHMDVNSRAGLKLPLAYYTGASNRQLVKYLRLTE